MDAEGVPMSEAALTAYDPIGDKHWRLLLGLRWEGVAAKRRSM